MLLRRPADFLEVASLHTESWRRFYRGIYSDAFLDGAVVAYNQKKWRERFADLDETRNFLLGAYEGEELIGFTYAVKKSGDAHGILLDNLHVASAHQKRGVGQKLLSAAARWAIPHKLPLYLEVLAKNKDAITFYARRGGQKIKEFDETLADGSVVATLIYQWRDPAVLL